MLVFVRNYTIRTQYSILFGANDAKNNHIAAIMVAFFGVLVVAK